MARRKITYEMVKQEFDERGYILLSKEYHKNSEKLDYICPHHKEKGIQQITFQNFTSGSGCPYCGGTKQKTPDEYIIELAEKAPNIEVLEPYVNLKTKILHKCKDCNYIWSVKPDLILHSGNGCPKCGKRARLTQEELIQRVSRIDDTIEVVGNYVNLQTKIDFKCTKCGNVWSAKPGNILSGRGCPHCRTPKGEKRVAELLDKYNIIYKQQYIYNDCRYIEPLKFDFYLVDYNKLIEYDGLQHFEPCRFGGISLEEAEENLRLSKIKDEIKNKYCQHNNIPLLRIPYWEFNNIEQHILSFIN